ncbi:MAG: DPP IV N-terminal domain-containing protein, partial [Actinomycetota bacterium]|nr:DPP IV N-terminal domain-containing protein [Actinomycetota bacterium]
MDFPAQYARTRRFSLGAPRSIMVAGGGRFVYFLRATQGDDPLLCLWSFDPETRVETLLVDPRQLLGDSPGELPAAERARRERARESATGIVDFSTSTDGTTIAFALNGELFVHRAGTTHALAAADGVFDPRVDPTGTAVAYVANDALHLIELDANGAGTDATTEVASDPDPLVSWGKAEFVAAEEMDRSRGFWWSPDGRELLVARVDNRPVEAWWIGDPANPQRAPHEIRYPAAGTANAAVELWITDRTGERRSIDWSDGGAYEYLNQVVWTAGHAPLIVRETRDQRSMSIGLVDTTSGIATEIRRVADDVWVEGFPGSPTWSGTQLLTIEDRTEVTGAPGGRRALCVDGQVLDLPGTQVRSIVGTTANGRIVVSAWTDPTEVHVGLVEPGSPAT